MAWFARCHYGHIHGSAVLWWTEPSLSTDSGSLPASGLAEAAARHVGTAAVHACCGRSGDGNAQSLVCGQCYWHFVVYVCCVPSVGADNACQSGELSILPCMNPLKGISLISTLNITINLSYSVNYYSLVMLLCKQSKVK